ncbi:MAG TPA: hypothetical protein ENG50_02610 [Candidatus Altiarchaeales archaeon]|nr:hypothetical protein [Candidatus Altiarchaeales archaeon]
MPEVYIEKLKISKEILRRHLIPLNKKLWKADRESYEKFLEERAKLLASAFEDYINSCVENAQNSIFSN